MAETRLIQGRYQLLDRIGRGGMGEVWRARDESLGRQVAVKCLKPLGPRHENSYLRVLRERFRREARVAASLQHRGVTVVHDFGEHEGVLFLVMELLDGRNLSQLLEDNKQHPLPVTEVTEIAEQVGAALAYTHRQGIVHRDLKPANIMRLTDGTVKICDFGIARLAHDIGFTARLTGGGVAMGTPHYMSPEQIGAGSVDHRSDLYSLGCVLYEMATGVPPFDMDDAWSVLVGHRDTPPRPPREHRPELPVPLERVILGLLAKDPDDRPEDAAELVRRVAEARRTEEVPVPRVPPPPPVTEPRLPAWAKEMTTGSKAVGTDPQAPVPPDPAEALTGSWTAPGPRRPAGGGTERPPPPATPLTELTTRQDEALRLCQEGRWSEAGEVQRSVVAERERLLGAGHPDTLAARYDLGATLARLGHLDEALREYARTTDGRSRTLGPDHPDTLAARQESAHVLGLLGRHFEAREVYAAVLAARERTQGPDHPATLRCGHNLAFSLGRLGRPEDSYRTALEVAAARARVLGADHPDTLVTRCEVAHVLSLLERRRDALRIYRDVAAARSRVLGADHPDTLAARYEAGICLGRLGRDTEALDVFRTLVEDRSRLLGPVHPETLRARHAVGINLGRLHRWEEALTEARDVAAIRARVLGTDHPDTLVSRREVAVGLGWLGRWPDALAVYRDVAQARQRVLGADHPDALASRNDEAHCLEQLGRSAEAVELYRQVAALRHTRSTRERSV
ncbi:tetratricopeptide repeat protein [Streptomyces sp. NPDC052396]|uniref:serine/threonine-protein kinase n=1 Tax=Streptomyces sp. NPDC052396 TaxID=3365689 RepID=UPI0037D241B2